MNARPKSITIISWFLIITSLMSVVTIFFTYDNPEAVKLMKLSAMPITLQYIMMAVGVAITVLSGVLMLKANNIGRLMYVSWTAISLIIGLATSPSKAMMIPSVIFFAVITLFLFMKKSNQYFSTAHSEEIGDS